MAHSPFLQDMARRYTINLNLRRENKLLVCRYVLESLEQHFPGGPGLVLPAIGSIERYLRDLDQEFQVMHGQKELEFFLRTGSIKSIDGIERNIGAACDHAYAAGEAHRDQNHSLSSSEVKKCHLAIKRTIGVIIIEV